MAAYNTLQKSHERYKSVAYPSLQYSVLQHTIPTQKHHIANPTQENSSKSAPSILYGNKYNMRRPYLPLFSCSANALAPLQTWGLFGNIKHRQHRKASLVQKNGLPFFCTCPPTTQCRQEKLLILQRNFVQYLSHILDKI